MAAPGLSLVVVRGLTEVAFLVVDHRLLGTQASAVVTCGLWSPGSVTVMHRLSCLTACRIFLDQGLNLCPLLWQADS